MMGLTVFVNRMDYGKGEKRINFPVLWVWVIVFKSAAVSNEVLLKREDGGFLPQAFLPFPALSICGTHVWFNICNGNTSETWFAALNHVVFI